MFVLFFPDPWTVRHMGLGMKMFLRSKLERGMWLKRPTSPSTPLHAPGQFLGGKKKKEKHPLVLISTHCTCIYLFRRGWPESLLKI